MFDLTPRTTVPKYLVCNAKRAVASLVALLAETRARTQGKRPGKASYAAVHNGPDMKFRERSATSPVSLDATKCVASDERRQG